MYLFFIDLLVNITFFTMTLTIGDFLSKINDVAPFSLAEPWDNVGLLIGSSQASVSSILLSVDPGYAVLKEAIEKKCDTIISHHPIIFKPLPNINTETPTGRFIQTALHHSISVIACHTNLDSAADGVSDALGRALGITNMEPMLESGGTPLPGTGLGRIGSCGEKISGHQFVRNVLNILNLDSVQVAGPIPAKIDKVALCGGSGSDLAEKAKKLGADIYLTAEVKHNIARWAEEVGFCIIDGTHYSTEQFAVTLLQEKLTAIAAENMWNVKIKPTETEHPPFVSFDKDSL